MTGEWLDRIDKKVVLVAPDQLLAHPLNARRHPGQQRDAIRASLGAVGWVMPVMVNVTTGRVLDGHARIEEALTKGVPKVPVLYVTLDEAEEALVLATFDPIAAMATYDGETFGMLLADLSAGEAEMDESLEALIRSIDASSGSAAGRDVSTIMAGIDAGSSGNGSVLSGVSDVGDERRSLVFALTAADHAVVTSILSKIRDADDGMESQGDALVYLCSTWKPSRTR